MVKVTVNQKIHQVLDGTTLAELAKQVKVAGEPMILLAYMNGKLKELFAQVEDGSYVRFVTLKEQTGYMAYKRTATMMFLKACEELFGKVRNFLEREHPETLPLITPLETVFFVNFQKMREPSRRKLQKRFRKKWKNCAKQIFPFTRKPWILIGRNAILGPLA